MNKFRAKTLYGFNCISLWVGVCGGDFDTPQKLVGTLKRRLTILAACVLAEPRHNFHIL